MTACPVYPGEQVDCGPRCCDLSCRMPPEPGMVWLPPAHLVNPGTSLSRCTSCDGIVGLTPPCVPGKWASWAREPLALADLERDGRGDQ